MKAGAKIAKAAAVSKKILESIKALANY